MIKVRLVYVGVDYVAEKEIKIPHLFEGMEIAQIFDSVIKNDNEGEIFTIVKIRLLLQEKIYLAFVKKESHSPYDRGYFVEEGWQTK